MSQSAALTRLNFLFVLFGKIVVILISFTIQTNLFDASENNMREKLVQLLSFLGPQSMQNKDQKNKPKSVIELSFFAAAFSNPV